MSNAVPQPPGWYQAQGDPPGTQRYWDGSRWQGGPQPIPGLSGPVAPNPTATNPMAMVGGRTIARPGKRVLARTIDWAIWIGVIFMGGGAITATSDISIDGDSTTSEPVQFLVVVGFVALLAAYEVLMVASIGGTIGKKALGLQVVTDDGAAVTLPMALLRFSPFVALVLIQQIPVIGAIGTIGMVISATAALMMLFVDARVQVPWDKLAKTLVVEG